MKDSLHAELGRKHMNALTASDRSSMKIGMKAGSREQTNVREFPRKSQGVRAISVFPNCGLDRFQGRAGMA